MGTANDTYRIKKPDGSPTVEFESTTGKTYKVKVTVLNHLYGEGLMLARIAEGINADAQPRTITAYDGFHTKLAEHLGVTKTDIAEETVHLLAEVMNNVLSDLKKTCVSVVNSQS